MFSLVCVCQSVYPRGSPYVTITRDALDFTVQPPSSPASDIWWPSLEACLNLFTGHHYTASPTGTDIWWPPKCLRLASEWYASYWNAFSLDRFS